MKRHSFSSISTGARAAAFVASTLTVLALALAPAAYAQYADDTVALEQPLPAFEENSPTDETRRRLPLRPTAGARNESSRRRSTPKPMMRR